MLLAAPEHVLPVASIVRTAIVEDRTPVFMVLFDVISNIELGVAADGQADRVDDARQVLKRAADAQPARPSPWLALGRLEEAFREGRYDIVHVHTPIAAFVTRFALRRVRRRRPTRVVYTAHGFHFYRGQAALPHALFRTMERTAAPWTDYLVTINREDFDAAHEEAAAPAPAARPGTWLARAPHRRRCNGIDRRARRDRRRGRAHRAPGRHGCAHSVQPGARVRHHPRREEDCGGRAPRARRPEALMASEIVIPRMGLTMETGTIVAWLRKPGERVKKGEPLLETETDKATVEVESPAEGVLASILAQAGETLAVGAVRCSEDVGFLNPSGWGLVDMCASLIAIAHEPILPGAFRQTLLQIGFHTFWDHGTPFRHHDRMAPMIIA